MVTQVVQHSASVLRVHLAATVVLVRQWMLQGKIDIVTAIGLKQCDGVPSKGTVCTECMDLLFDEMVISATILLPKFPSSLSISLQRFHPSRI